MEREQIIKALECCITPRDCDCDDCPLDKYGSLNCKWLLMSHSLALIKELTEERDGLYRLVDDKIQENKRLTDENERLHASCTELTRKCASLEADVAKEFTCVFGTPHKVSDCPIDDEIAKAKADTVRKMQERLKECFPDTVDGKAIYTAGQVIFGIDEIAKEMLEGKE